MNELKPAARSPAAYHTDFFAWTADQSRRLRGLKPVGVDWENLAEEVESLGRSNMRAVGSVLKVVLEHLIKWQFQLERRSSSWRDSIEEHPDRILRILENSLSLAELPGEILDRQYGRARRKALRDTRLPPKSVPATSPFTAEEALDLDFWPHAQEPGRGEP